MQHNKRFFIIIILLTTAIFVFSKCIDSTQAADPRGKLYAGAASCRSCHQAIYDSMLVTAHFNSTATVNDTNVHGSFAKGHNSFLYTNGTTVQMEKRDSGFYQVLYAGGKQQEAHRFDVVFGSKNAQTYLYWNENKAYELPISFYNVINGWATSPGGGFSNHTAYFNRLINVGCFECHSASIETKGTMTSAVTSQEFVPGTLLAGIDCERCHGPAMNHVNYHEAYPEEKKAKYMVTNYQLSKQQKLDACAICHGGNDKDLISSRFQFSMGDTLANFVMPFGLKKESGSFDVHGNQSNLLAQSKCFKGIAEMTCSTCHSPHGDADKDLAIYSQKCMTCHIEAQHNFCPKMAEIGPTIKNNCIDCHMPKQPSKAITFQLPGSVAQSAYMLRNHHIGIYGSSTMNKKN